MAARTAAAPPPPTSAQAEASIQASTSLYPMADISGDVRIGSNVSVAPGSSLRADGGAPFFIGQGATIQPGASIYGLGQGRVLGDDQAAYSVWIGANAAITHKVLIHGPAYVGEGCFVGFRSTLFNARLGQGCIVMMHALVQDVDVPPGKLVPSGMVLTQQEQADRLPDVQPADLALAQEVMGQPANLRSADPAGRSQGSGLAASSPSEAQPFRHQEAQPFRHPEAQPLGQSSEARPLRQSNERDGLNTMQSQRLTSEIVQQVRQFLSQGYRIGMEHADLRRYRSGVWQTCTPIASNRESEVLAALETCLAEHGNEYVRMFGVDPIAKRRVSPVTIQHADGKPLHISTTAVSAPVSGGASSNGHSPAGGLTPQVVQQVRQMLGQGYRIGTEHADTRRYRSGVWQTCTPIASNRESDVLSALQSCLTEHSNEYVRMFGIDPKAKNRIAPVTIQRPGGQPAQSGGAAPQPAGYGSSSHSSSHSSAPVGSDVVQMVRQLVNQGYRIGMEHADARRYRSGVWQTCSPIQAQREAEAMAALQQCLNEHPGEYVRIFGIDPKNKSRLSPITVQRPGAPASVGQPAPAAPAAPAYGQSNGAASKPLTGDLVQQVHQLINQGYKIGLEYADVRRYRSGAWQTAAPVHGSRASDVVAAVEGVMREHSGHYVRLVGIDPQAKKRVLETTIQRP
jgi:carbon dioxide concentrating mechanism protein CcmM